VIADAGLVRMKSQDGKSSVHLSQSLSSVMPGEKIVLRGAVKTVGIEEVIKMMNIKPSAAIRKNYNEISELCKRSGEPVYLTKNGEGDLVVMDIVAFAKRESMLRLRENVVAAEEGRLSGKKDYSVDEVSKMMKDAVKEVLDGQRK
jgi:antitoxin (DNA-binding transcriptional repressor) of toxin-antitoxin stability system